MKITGFLSNEIKQAAAWTGRVFVLSVKLIFRAVLRLALMGVVLFLLGGGCFVLKSYVLARRDFNAEPAIRQNRSPEPIDQTGPRRSSYRSDSESIESRIRSGRSQLRSWNSMLRSVKDDIARWLTEK